MTVLHATTALLPEGWRPDVRLTLSAGRFAAVEVGAAAQPGDERHAILLPGMPNLHSHAFQRGMAGLAEFRGGASDTFWTWRDLMYRFALALTPEGMEAIAAQLYVEMLEAGFTRVGEFHYLHHDRDGRPYADCAEMAGRIAAAAQLAGIALTLLPVFYAHATFGGTPPEAGQRRFVCDLDGYARLLERCRTIVAGSEGAVVGVAPHSLRAVAPDELAALMPLAAGGPVHIHAAEQLREVEDCLAWSGQRPVDWLLDHAPLDARWCLVHATHMTDAETSALAGRGTVAGLCPVTEANLGDGVFKAALFTGADGRFGIGSDSNIAVGVADELRQLEYAQRLHHHARNVMAVAGGSTGRALFEGAVRGGGLALGIWPEGLTAGAVASAVSLRADDVGLVGRTGDALLDAWIFGARGRVVDCVWVAGRKQVEGGVHRLRAIVAAAYRKAVEALLA